jgi:hypothetical protein
MDRVASHQLSNVELAEITRREVERYVATWHEGRMLTILDDAQKRYIVVDLPHYPRRFPAGIVVMARVEGDLIIIEEDTTDRPLMDALMVNGQIPREQIVLAYMGELNGQPDILQQD